MSSWLFCRLIAEVLCSVTSWEIPRDQSDDPLSSLIGIARERKMRVSPEADWKRSSFSSGCLFRLSHRPAKHALYRRDETFGKLVSKATASLRFKP
jgi:hypothetical protein